MISSRRARWAAAAAVLALGLAGCSTTEHHTASAPSSTAASSASASTATATAASSATSSASASASSSPSSAVPSNPAVMTDEIQDPGASCGTPAGFPNDTVYVSGGSISCKEAVTVVQAYAPKAPAAAAAEGYNCRTSSKDVEAAESLKAVCVQSDGPGYVEVRPSEVRVQAGLVEDVSQHEVPALNGVFGAHATAFKSPDGSVVCATGPKVGVTCWAKKDDDDWTQLTMAGSGSASSSTVSGPSVDASTVASVRKGTVYTAAGVSCKPTEDDAVKCLNQDSQFELHDGGYHTD